MEKISRRNFLKRSVAIGAGAVLMIYANGTYRMVLSSGTPAYSLRILHTNDHHSRIEPVQVTIRSSPSPAITRNFGGVSRRKALIDSIRTANPTQNILLLDAGDIFQGTLYFNQYNGQADLFFYNGMGYDAVAVGNHEFDRGQAPLRDFIQGANFPMLSANITVEPTATLAPVWVGNTTTAANGQLGPRTIVTRGGESIGIFGLTTPDTAILSSPGAGVTFDSNLATIAQAQVDALRTAGANKIIALTHLGYPVDQQLAAQVRGINVIIGGHTHTPLLPTTNPPSPVGIASAGPYPTTVQDPDGKNVVIVTDWEWGKWLGDITVDFDASHNIIAVTGVISPVWANGLGTRELLPGEQPEITPDAAFETQINDVYKPPLDVLRNTVIGSASVELDGARNNVRSRETNLGNLICDALLDKTRPDGGQVVIMNGGGIRASIPSGDVTVGEVLEVLPFGNTIARVDITGAQLKTALENGVSQVESAAGRFPQIAGMRFTWARNLPAGRRVQKIEIATEGGFVPVDPAATYRVITNNFMLTGGDGYSVFTQGTNGLDTGFILADVVMDYIEANTPVSPTVEGRITAVNLVWQPMIFASGQPAAQAPVTR